MSGASTLKILAKRLPCPTPMQAAACISARCTSAAVKKWVAGVFLLAGTGVFAMGPTGTVGPIGPAGPTGPSGLTRHVDPHGPDQARGSGAHVSPPPNAAASAAPRLHDAGRAAAEGNRIEVTGNTASGTRCGPDGTASVNSVDVSGAKLQGRTVIVQGHNTVNTVARDCPKSKDTSGRGTHGPSQVNSIRIR